MNRRELFRKAVPLTLVPFVKLSAFGKELDAIEVKPRKFLIFCDERVIDIESLARDPIPGWEDIDGIIIPVRLNSDQKISDVLQLVERFEVT